MKGITRSRLVPYCDTAEKIYRNAAELLDGIERRPVRLVGAGVYNLSGEEDQQLSMEDLAGGGDETDMETLLERLGLRYGLDFAGNLDKIYKADTLHRTVEYMRKHI
jgi:DNA polymerase-4/DNA polymerase IV (DinB-like DNA polymerase)